MDLAPDFDEFIGSLIANEVEFVIVGAYALAFHGAPRYTGDIDILIRPTIDNARRALSAIEACGFPINQLTPNSLIDARRMLEMGVEPVQIHIMSRISGVTWDEAWASRVIGAFGTHDVPLIGREAFLRNKRAAGRPKDLALARGAQCRRERVP